MHYERFKECRETLARAREEEYLTLDITVCLDYSRQPNVGVQADIHEKQAAANGAGGTVVT